MLDSIFNFKRLDVAKLDFYAIYKNYPKKKRCQRQRFFVGRMFVIDNLQ